MTFAKTKIHIHLEESIASYFVMGGVLCIGFFLFLNMGHDFSLNLIEKLFALEGILILYGAVEFWKLRKRKNDLMLEEKRAKGWMEFSQKALFLIEGSAIVEVNAVAAQILGYEPSELAGKNLNDCITSATPEDPRKWMGLGGPWDGHLRMARRKDGTDFPLWVKEKDVLYQERRARLLSGWNIFEIHKMRELRGKGEEQFQMLLNTAQEGILILDDDLIVDVNQTLADMTGRHRSDFIGRDGLFFLDQKSSAKMKKNGIFTREPCEIKLLHSNGTVVEARLVGMNILWDGKKRMAARIWSTPDREKIGKLAMENQDRFKRFAEVMKEGIFIHDNGVIVDVNQALAAMLGFSVGEMIGRKTTDFTDEKTNRMIQKYRKERYPSTSYEVTLRRKDGTMFPAEIHGTGFTLNGKNFRVARLWDVTQRKKMEEALLESQERFERFSKVSKEGIAIHDNGLIVDMNGAGAEILGYGVEEVIGRQLVDLLDDVSARKIMEFSQTDLPDYVQEINVIRKDQSLLSVEATGTFFNVRGKKFRILNFWDLTNRKKMEEALKKSEHSFRHLIEKSPDAIIIHTATQTVYVNDAMLHLLGYSAAHELIGTIPTFIVYPDDVSMVDRRVERLKNPGDYNSPQEKRFIRKDGVVLFVDVVSFMIYFEGGPAVVAVARDLTKRKQAEEALKQSEESFRNLIEKSPDGIIIHTLDPKPKIVYVNEAMIKFVGYSADELMTNEFGFFIHPKDMAGMFERVDKLRANEKYNPPREKLLIRKDGTVAYSEVVSFLIHYEGVPMVAVVVRDLTERKKAEETLMRFERLSTIGVMAAGMAHEIRNPLAAISTAAQILKRKVVKENKGQLETILEQSDRLEKLVRDTLDYSKSSKGRIRHLFSVKSAMESALNLCKIQFGPAHQKIKIIWDLPEKDIQLNADSGQLQQILVNLILNAFQIIDHEGKVKLGIRSNEEYVFIRVEDNGPGITDSNIKRIFEPFFTTKDHGSGLGLAISQRIARENGGQILIERLNPKGTAFILQVPLNGGKNENPFN